MLVSVLLFNVATFNLFKAWKATALACLQQPPSSISSASATSTIPSTSTPPINEMFPILTNDHEEIWTRSSDEPIVFFFERLIRIIQTLISLFPFKLIMQPRLHWIHSRSFRNLVTNINHQDSSKTQKCFDNKRKNRKFHTSWTMMIFAFHFSHLFHSHKHKNKQPIKMRHSFSARIVFDLSGTYGTDPGFEWARRFDSLKKNKKTMLILI